MAIRISERPGSREIIEDPPELHLELLTEFEVDEWTALTEVYWALPVTYNHPGAGKIWVQPIRLVPDGFARYIATVKYAARRREQGSASFSFDTTGATFHVKCGLSHINDYALDGNNVNRWKGAINATPEGVEGVDIIIPACRFQYTFRHPRGEVTEAFALSLAAATGKTNSVAWRDFAAGEALFAGATGADGTDTDATLTYNIIASQNATGLTVGEITGIAKRGHDVLWVEFEPDANVQAIQVPRRVNVDRVYREADFGSVFGWE